MSFLPSKTNSFCSSYILFIYIWNRSIFDKGNWLISKRLGEQTTSTRPLISQKDDRGNNTGDIPLINWWHFQWITLPQESTNTSPLNRLVSLRWRVTIRSTGWRSWRGPMWTCLVLTNAHVWKYLAHHAQRPYYVPVSSSYGKTSQNLENPNTRSPLQGKIPTSKGSWFAIRHYISTRPSLFSRT